MTKPEKRSRIQIQNRKKILTAALEVFSEQGFRGATLDQIAQAAGMSKPNILYYFVGKEEIHRALLEEQLEDWLAPLKAINADGDPVEEIIHYALRKLEFSKVSPHESRLFANEILRGASHIADYIEGELKALVDEKAALIACWAEAGRIQSIDPYQLLFSIWATTQHYADFEAQMVRLIGDEDRFEKGAVFIEQLFRGRLSIRD